MNSMSNSSLFFKVATISSPHWQIKFPDLHRHVTSCVGRSGVALARSHSPVSQLQQEANSLELGDEDLKSLHSFLGYLSDPVATLLLLLFRRWSVTSDF